MKVPLSAAAYLCPWPLTSLRLWFQPRSPRPQTSGRGRPQKASLCKGQAPGSASCCLQHTLVLRQAQTVPDPRWLCRERDPPKGS